MTTPELPPGVVHVWSIERDPGADLDAAFLLLSADERERADRLRLADRRESFIRHRTYVRRILGAYAGIEPSDVCLTTSQHGKPRWQQPEGHPPLAFNLTHCGELAFLAVTAASTVGIDCEVLNPQANYEAVARQALSSRELAAYERLPAAQRPVAVVRAWTCKEAYLKAVGVGLARPLCTIEVAWTTPDVPRLLATGSERESPADWELQAWSPEPDCFVALAAPRECVPQKVLFLSAASLGDRSASLRDRAAPPLASRAGAWS